MIREQGVVVSVQDGVARVAVEAPDHAQCRSCGICTRAQDDRRLIMEVRAPERLKVGDRVTVEVPVPGPVRSAMLILLVPLVLFVGGVLMSAWLQERGALPDGAGLSVLLGLVLMAAWYGTVAVYDRHLRRSPEHQPRIVSRPAQGED